MTTGTVRVPEALLKTPGALVRLGCSLMASGKGAQAVALVRGLLEEHPDDPQVATAARLILSQDVPGWHRAMLADRRRNDAFEAAIAKAAPGKTVLDIGTGSGLLALMAARAGAAKVIACERHPALAETARDIVAANGFADVVTVLARHSTELSREELGGGADVVVGEVFSDDLISEGVLKTIGHARDALARPGAAIIPAAGSIRVALCRYERDATSLSDVSGFDLTLFDRHVVPFAKIGIGDSRLEITSVAADLFAFDFASGATPDPRAQLSLTAGPGGANAVAQWIRLRLDGDGIYENRPEHGDSSHWAVAVHPFPPGTAAGEGETVLVNGAHDGERLQIWAEPAA